MSSYLDKYRARVNLKGSNIREYQTANARRTFERALDIMPNSHVIPLIAPDGSVEMVRCIIDDIRELDDRLPDDKKMNVPYDTTVEVGYEFAWEGKHWISIIREHSGLLSHIPVRVRPCNYELKWVDDGGFVRSNWVVVTNKTLYSDGVQSTNTAVIPNQKMHIAMPYNQHSRKLGRGKRVMLFEDTYKITNIDRSENGLMQFILTEEPLSDGDDTVNYIADAHLIQESSIQLVNPSPMTISLGGTVQLNPRMVNAEGDEVIAPFTYVSSDASIASVSDSGVVTGISEGSVVITVESSNLTHTVAVSVASSAVSNTSIEIIGAQKITAGGTSYYVVQTYIDGVESDGGFTASIVNASTMDCATIVSQTADGITVRADSNSIGETFDIQVECGGVTETKQVTIKSIFG